MDDIKKLFNIRRLFGKPEKVDKSIDKIFHLTTLTNPKLALMDATTIN